jgi:hypothetical protein
MAMVKIISPSGWDFDRPIAVPIKVSSRGLIGNDRREFLKTASHIFVPHVDELVEKMGKDLEPVHLISHGATEAYGPNRNGDGFKEATCKRYADTFEKFAHWHRNHKNKVENGDPYYGLVKKAGYNDPMRRVELLVGLFKTKEAAERHGKQAFVADRELTKLASGKDLAVSMACRVPYDQCSYCDHKARTRDDYCTASMCKAGGCKDNLTRVVKVAGDVHQLHVDNPHPTWFDISDVFRPADRIAYGAKADYLTKAAADDFDGFYGVSSAKLAEDLGVVAPMAVILNQDDSILPGAFSTAVEEQVKLAHGLDMLDRRPQLHPTTQVKLAFDRRMQGDFDIAHLGEPGTKKCAESLAALADEKIVLPLRDFSRLCKKAELADAAQGHLKGVYGRMISDGSLERRLTHSPFALSTKTAELHTRRWAARNAGAFSLEKSAVDHRCRLASVRDNAVPKTGFGIEKSAADNKEAEELARDYACYKVAALHRIAAQDEEFMLTARISVAQNQVV